jgi:hypothetical protein
MYGAYARCNTACRRNADSADRATQKAERASVDLLLRVTKLAAAWLSLLSVTLCIRAPRAASPMHAAVLHRPDFTSCGKRRIRCASFPDFRISSFRG